MKQYFLGHFIDFQSQARTEHWTFTLQKIQRIVVHS